MESKPRIDIDDYACTSRTRKTKEIKARISSYKKTNTKLQSKKNPEYTHHSNI